jgi:acetylornithine deacetylase/succinyl-diaminopimelate desuccinylase-like protein
MPGLQEEAVALLGQLIRHRTVNPPGAERPAQELLAGLLRDAGFEVTLVGRTEERPNLVARLRGRSDGTDQCLLSHLDTDLATPAHWRQDPWSGEEIDGEVWGRGAIDMKSQTAAEVVAAISLAREGWRPARGDLLVVSVVDEEVGGTDGAIWLCDNHPELVRCDYLLNEGAGAVVQYGGQRQRGVSIAEKGVFRFKLVTDGVAGHASNPSNGVNALLKVAPLLQAMRDRRPAYDVTDAPGALLAGLGVATNGDPAAALDQVRAVDPWLAGFVEPMLSVTLAPTRALASEKINVIPARAEIEVDCRTPPGMERATVLARIDEELSGEEYRLEFFEEVVGNSSPVDTPLYAAIERWIAANDPGARVIPTMLPAFTDSRTFRAAFPDCVAYGFFPHRHMTLQDTWPMLHAADERIDARDMGFATACYRDVCKELLGDR